jgi:hypothetical protein
VRLDHLTERQVEVLTGGLVHGGGRRYLHGVLAQVEFESTT